MGMALDVWKDFESPLHPLIRSQTIPLMWRRINVSYPGMARSGESTRNRRFSSDGEEGFADPRASRADVTHSSSLSESLPAGKCQGHR